ncbi:MAG TPA: GNAT family N-acetyltransferase [Coleofasciculaceae cyanobacterium]|jgi:predicted GNAT family acetyltransferase
MANQVIYKTDLKNVDWLEMKSTLASDAFDNGRTPSQLQASFENSYAAVIAYANTQIIGTARVLSDGVCNAYIVDVWTLTQYRKRGIATTMMELLLAKLEGQHVYLFTDDSLEFYEKLGFKAQPTGLGKVVGQWLQNKTS